MNYPIYTISLGIQSAGKMPLSSTGGASSQKMDVPLHICHQALGLAALVSVPTPANFTFAISI